MRSNEYTGTPGACYELYDLEGTSRAGDDGKLQVVKDIRSRKLDKDIELVCYTCVGLFTPLRMDRHYAQTKS